MKLLVPARALALAVAALTWSQTAHAQATSVAVYPPNGSRFLPGQRFDLRVEGKGAAPFTASLTVNGKPVQFTSGTGNPVTTDGISPFDLATNKGFGGFNVRGHSLHNPGKYTLAATFTDGSGVPVTATSTITVEPLRGEGAGIKNVVIFLGDGMGIAHRTAARIVSRGVTAGTPGGRLAMDTMPGVGLLSTHSLNSIVTDSAPGMACYTTGNHFRNNQEGVFPANVTNPFFAPRVEYLGAYFHRTRGTALGIVTTADVEDATPAANAVYTQARGNGTGICDQYLDEAGVGGTRTFGSGLKVLMGGGRRWFVPATHRYSSRSDANDYPALPPDLLAGWSIPAARAGALDKTRDLVVDHQAPDQPMLDEMTKAALSVLERHRRGFVLMVEGAHIDKQSHQMDAERAIGETIELDRAIQVALDHARADGQTLVIVTSDHECSGFALIGGLNGIVPAGQPHAGARGLAGATSLPSDAAATDPATAPGRQWLVGTYDVAGFPKYPMLPDGYPSSYDVEGKLLVGFGANGDRYENWLTPTKPTRESLTPANLASELAALLYAPSPAKRSEKTNGYFIRGQAVGQEQAVHTASDVPISAYARNPFAWLPFVGVYENTDVFFKIAQVMDRDR